MLTKGDKRFRAGGIYHVNSGDVAENLMKINLSKLIWIYKKMNMPRMVSPGDTIGIVSPASPFDEADFYAGIEVLETMGFRVRFPEDIFARSGYLAGSDVKRAEQVNAAFSDESIQAIICARGGYGSMRILPYIDYELIRMNPKLFMGFSDNTALLFAMYKFSGLISFHGPVATTLRNAGKETLESVFQAFTSNNSLSIKPRNGVMLNPGKASGNLLCANLTTLCHLTGTPFQPALRDHILIIEDRGEKPYRIDRMLTQMSFAGLLDGLCGIGIGSFEDCGEMDEVYKIILKTFNHMNIPVLAGFDIGHGPENIAVPFGRRAFLDTDLQTLSFDYDGS